MDDKKAPRWWFSRATGWSESRLKSFTHAYWDRKKPDHLAAKHERERIKWYINKLLPEELLYAEKQGTLKDQKRCHTLALLVGYSLEPLLQAISVFEPLRVVLLLNQWYGGPKNPERQSGESLGKEVKEWIETLLVPLLDRPPTTVYPYLVADRPDEVFRALCDLVLYDQKEGKSIIVDITGAKKSMVAGAFLFAAYADVGISYVDFDDFNRSKRRPYGFTCRIGMLTNPYDKFRLHEWERVRQLYKHAHFRAAAETLMDILPIMRQPMFETEHIQAAKGLMNLLRFYEAWDDGDYYQAKELQNHLPGFHPPAAVALLGQRWPHVENVSDEEDAAWELIRLHDELQTAPHSIFESNQLFLAYVRDELAKIQRLVDNNEDNRSALLRVAGLDELLLKARLARLWQHRQLWVNYNRDSSFARPPAAFLRQLLLRYDGSEYMRDLLLQRPDSFLRLNYFVTNDGQYVIRKKKGEQGERDFVIIKHRHPANDEHILEEYWEYPDVNLSPDTLVELRNRAIHTYLYVTQSIAQAAVKLVEANLKEFEKKWCALTGAPPPGKPQDVEALLWKDVCDLCKLDFLPLAPQPKKEGDV